MDASVVERLLEGWYGHRVAGGTVVDVQVHEFRYCMYGTTPPPPPK